MVNDTCGNHISIYRTVTNQSTRYDCRMQKSPITPDRIRRALAETIKSGPVHLFADEADTIARNCVVMLRERFPSVFRKKAKAEAHES